MRVSITSLIWNCIFECMPSTNELKKFTNLLFSLSFPVVHAFENQLNFEEYCFEYLGVIQLTTVKVLIVLSECTDALSPSVA